MDTILGNAVKRLGRPRKSTPASVVNEEAGAGTTDNAGNGQVSESGTPTQKDLARARQARDMNIYNAVMAGHSYMVRKGNR